MNSLSGFKNECFHILETYRLKSFKWSQFTPIEDDVMFEININDIDGNKFDNLDMISKMAWEKLYKLLSSYSTKLVKYFGNNVTIEITQSEIKINEYWMI